MAQPSLALMTTKKTLVNFWPWKSFQFHHVVNMRVWVWALNLCLLASPFSQDLGAIALTCNDLLSLWSSSNFHTSQRKCFFCLAPSASERKFCLLYILGWFSERTGTSFDEGVRIKNTHITEIIELRNRSQFRHRCPAHFSPTSSNSFPASMFKFDSNQPETLPVTKSPSSSMKLSIVFLLKFIWRFFPRSYNLPCVLNSALRISGASRWSKRTHAGK